jgi:hypothetical protein
LSDGASTLGALILSFILFGGLAVAPEILIHLIFGDKEKADEQEKQQLLLDRKQQIYEEMVAAKARGEQYALPADWNAS